MGNSPQMKMYTMYQQDEDLQNDIFKDLLKWNIGSESELLNISKRKILGSMQEIGHWSIRVISARIYVMSTIFCQS